jgi:hypothetical protein
MSPVIDAVDRVRVDVGWVPPVAEKAQGVGRGRLLDQARRAERDVFEVRIARDLLRVRVADQNEVRGSERGKPNRVFHSLSITVFSGSVNTADRRLGTPRVFGQGLLGHPG